VPVNLYHETNKTWSVINTRRYSYVDSVQIILVLDTREIIFTHYQKSLIPIARDELFHSDETNKINRKDNFENYYCYNK